MLLKNLYLCLELIINLFILSKMKKVFLSLAVIAALTVVSCKQAEATDAAATDSTAVEAIDTTAAAIDTAAAAIDTAAVKVEEAADAMKEEAKK